MQSMTRWCLNEASMSYGAYTFLCSQSAEKIYKVKTRNVKNRTLAT